MKRQSPLRTAAWLCAAALLSAATCGACGESGQDSLPSAPEAGVPDAPASFDARTDSARPDASVPDATAPDADAAPDGKPDCGPFTPPAAVPAGWERWNGWSCSCPLYVPGATGAMPEPIVWEPCQESIASTLSCRRMKHFWNETGQAMSIFPKLSLDPSSGKPLLAFTRYGYGGDNNTRYVMIAEADGLVRRAFLQVNPRFRGCEFTNEAIAEGRYVLWGLGDTWDGPLTDPAVPVVDGILAGRLSDPYPETVLKLPPDANLRSNWSVSARWLIQRKGVRTAWSWDLQKTQTVYDPAADPDHLRGGLVVALGDEVMVEVGDGLPAGVMTWNANDGIRPLLRWPGDGSQGACNFGTDGKDMVWTYIAGRSDEWGDYETMSVMTAPFTADGKQAMASARRLRSDVRGPDPYPWVAGCGYAARSVGLGPPWHSALFIVRLADGVSWLFSGQIEPVAEHWNAPLGITCEELFTVIETNATTRIVRIRLDSLGSGTPPD